MGCELADSLVVVRARSGCDEEMLGALFLQEERPELELDIIRLLVAGCWRVGAAQSKDQKRIDDGPVAALIACGKRAARCRVCKRVCKREREREADVGRQAARN